MISPSCTAYNLFLTMSGMQALKLEPFQRAFLRKQAHSLHPLVTIGRSGYTDAIRIAVDQALNSHELVKLKFLDARDVRETIVEDLSKKLGAAVVSQTGFIALLYRPGKDETKRIIHMPKAKVSSNG